MTWFKLLPTRTYFLGVLLMGPHLCGGYQSKVNAQTITNELTAEVRAPATNIIGTPFSVTVSLTNNSAHTWCIRPLGGRWDWILLSDEKGNSIPTATTAHRYYGPDTEKSFMVLKPKEGVRTEISCSWGHPRYGEQMSMKGATGYVLDSGNLYTIATEGSYSLVFLKRTFYGVTMQTKEGKYVAFKDVFSSPLYTNEIQSVPVKITFVKPTK